MNRWIVLAGYLASAAACGPVDPCDEYVDYMCACHGTEIDCNDLSLTYEGAASDVQDECAVLLDDQEDQDAEDGAECPSA